MQSDRSNFGRIAITCVIKRVYCEASPGVYLRIQQIKKIDDILLIKLNLNDTSR